MGRGQKMEGREGPGSWVVGDGGREGEYPHLLDVGGGDGASVPHEEQHQKSRPKQRHGALSLLLRQEKARTTDTGTR